MEIPIIRVTIRNMFPRLLEQTVPERLITLHKVLLILGARQVGKTTLLRSIESRMVQDNRRIHYLNCDLVEESRIFWLWSA